MDVSPSSSKKSSKGLLVGVPENSMKLAGVLLLVVAVEERGREFCTRWCTWQHVPSETSWI